MADFDAIVVGGGLIGMLTARELALGGMSVVIVERQQVGQESSWAGGGILSPLYPWRYDAAVSALARWSQDNYAELAEHLAQETGIDPEWTRSGLLMLGVEGEERDDAVTWAFNYGYEMEYLNAETIRQHESSLQWQQGGGIWMPEIAQMRNPRLLKSVYKHIEAMGVRFELNQAVNGIGLDEQGHPYVETASWRQTSDHVVVAGGAWSGGLVKPLGIELPITPVKGQMLLFKADPDLLGAIVLHGDRYLIPRRDGHILVGSTLEDTGFEKETTDNAKEDLESAAYEILPALRESTIEKQWAGLRPSTPNGIPYVGELPNYPGIYINSGHFRNGVVTGLASCRMLGDIILDRPPILDPAPYQP